MLDFFEIIVYGLVGLIVLVPMGAQAYLLRKNLSSVSRVMLLVIPYCASVLGFGISMLISGAGPDAGCDAYDWSCITGWDRYMAQLMVLPGLFFGVGYWLVMRRSIPYTGWVIPVWTLVGGILGWLIGVQQDRMIVVFGHTTNGLGERLGAGLVSGLVGGFLLLILVSMLILWILRSTIAWQEKTTGALDFK